MAEPSEAKALSAKRPTQPSEAMAVPAKRWV